MRRIKYCVWILPAVLLLGTGTVQAQGEANDSRCDPQLGANFDSLAESPDKNARRNGHFSCHERAAHSRLENGLRKILIEVNQWLQRNRRITGRSINDGGQVLRAEQKTTQSTAVWNWIRNVETTSTSSAPTQLRRTAPKLCRRKMSSARNATPINRS